MTQSTARQRIPYRLLLEPLESRQVPATFVVNSTLDLPDINPGNGIVDTGGSGSEITLRAAVMEANALAGADIIELPNGTYTLTRFGSFEDFADFGDLDVRDDLTIRPVAATGVAADVIIESVFGSGDRVFHVLDTAGGEAAPLTPDLSLIRLTIRQGTVFNDGVAFGGGICHAGTGIVDVTDSVIENNHADNGGGVAVTSTGTMNLTRCTLSQNSSGDEGGATWNSSGVINMTNCTLAGNVAGAEGFGEGGAVYLGFAGGSFFLLNCTVVGNSAGQGGGIFTDGIGAISLQNSLFAQNTGGNFFNTGSGAGYFSLGGNLEDANDFGFGSGDFSNTTPLLGGLTDNGGPTPTIALLETSPGINQALVSGAPGTDQRGVTRPQGAGFDIGAYEFVEPEAVVDVFVGKTVNELDSVFVSVGSTVTFTIIVSNFGSADATNVVVTDTVPKGFKITAVDASGGVIKRKGRKVTCTIDSLSSNQNVAITITAIAKKAGSYTNTASATQTEVDVNPENNVDPAFVDVLAQSGSGTGIPIFGGDRGDLDKP